MVNNVTVIIRSIGERTEQLCRELILAQGVPEENLFIVREAPFSAALRKSFEIGIERGLPWTLCNDADVLLRPGAVEHLVGLAEQQEENDCVIQGFILDKFFGGPRPGGIHLYRTSLLTKAIQMIPEEGVDIRPERHVLLAMNEQGYPYIKVPYLTGLHDFEQYYRDIFRKSFVHAHKHQKFLELFLSIWRSGSSHDLDYQAALFGLSAGIIHLGEVYIDIDSEIYSETLVNMPFGEKDSTLTISEFSFEKIEKIIADWVEPDIYDEQFPTKFGLNHLPKKKRIIKMCQEVGLIKLLLYILGSILTRVGNCLKNL